MTTVKGNDMAS